MKAIQGRNHIVQELLTRSEAESLGLKIFALFAIAWSWYSTRTPKQRENIADIVIGIPALCLLSIMFFFVLFL